MSTVGGTGRVADAGDEAAGVVVAGAPGSARGAARLPVAASTLVGREQERVEVAELVAQRRLVTLTGAGGCGKTRLALEVAGEVSASLPDAACWVGLEEIDDPDTVPAALADAVGVAEPPGRALVDTLVEQLRTWHGLVVLDNCEHVVEACAQLVAGLLRSCPQVRILATSRAPLGVEGETTWEVPPLPVPDPQARSAGAVGRAVAARLFEIRVRQVRPDFALTDDNAPAVGEICRRLDGIPLAVELAAARMRVLSPAQIAAGLSDRFRLLTGGAREAPTRQQTLEASVAWSFGLLSDRERLALARLSVFAGSFELEAAQAVVAGEDIGADALLDLVTALAERSLLQVVERDGVARYRLLETIRSFARERLAELDDPERVRHRHLDHYRGLAEHVGTGLAGPDAAAWMARLATELADLRAAMAWAVASDRPVAALDIAEPMQRFWLERGRYSEMERWLGAAVDAPAATDRDRLRGLVAAALVTIGGGRFTSAYTFADRAVPVARALGAEDALALSLGQRAFTGAMSGMVPSEQVDDDVDEAVALATGLEEATTRAYVCLFVGVTACYGRSIAEGEQRFEQAAAICEAAGASFLLPSAYAFLGTWSVFRGDLDRVREHAQQGVAWARRLDRPGFEATARSGLAFADLLAGDVDAARAQFADAESLLRARGLSPSIFEAMVRRWAAIAAYRAGATDEAREIAEMQRHIAHEQGGRTFEAWSVWLLGVLALEAGRHEDARERFEECRRLSADPAHPLTLGRALVELAALDDDPEQAWELAHEGLEVLADFDDRVGTADSLEVVAGLAAARGQADQALRLLAAAERFHDETGIVRFPPAAERAARHVDAARAALDEETAEACWAEGARLSLEQAVGYARRRRSERGRPPTGWASLTPAERDVARLVAEGRTNAEIAERLFVSVNTVKTHLSHVYAKVAVEGRTELAVEAARRDL